MYKRQRVYNLVENLCMSQGMKMPKINIINDDSLNAFASGINERTYTVSLSRGIIDKLNDQELEAVIAHELSHIRNKDAVSYTHLDVYKRQEQPGCRQRTQDTGVTEVAGLFQMVKHSRHDTTRTAGRGRHDLASASVLLGNGQSIRIDLSPIHIWQSKSG